MVGRGCRVCRAAGQGVAGHVVVAVVAADDVVAGRRAHVPRVVGDLGDGTGQAVGEHAAGEGVFAVIGRDVVVAGRAAVARPVQHLGVGLAVGNLGRVAGALVLSDAAGDRVAAGLGAGAVAVRSEEHTSELQSLMRISYAVFC